MSDVRVLVVDDSAFMRRAISVMLESETGIAIAGTARSGEEAVEKVRLLHPDVVTMDVEMPGMGGLAAVEAILAAVDVPIVMVSALTTQGAETTFRALELGAVDFIAKPDGAYANISDVRRDLLGKVRAFARPRARAPRIERVANAAARDAAAGGARCIAVGTSTGGPVALSRVLPMLPAAFAAPLLVVQHMPRGFTRPLAARLHALCAIEVLEGEEGMEMRAGRAIVVPSGRQAGLARVGRRITLQLRDDDGTSLHVPSVDAAFEAVSATYGASAAAVVMTGMGQDGVVGLRALKQRGGYAIGQDEASCVVYGMPRAAYAAGLLDGVLPLDDIPSALCELTGSPQRVS
jgi:two-component system chemotaxis response regulator CheB